MDKISIIIPVKNEEDKIERCLEAVFSQTIMPCEVIVVNEHSTDNTVENAKKFPVKMSMKIMVRSEEHVKLVWKTQKEIL